MNAAKSLISMTAIYVALRAACPTPTVPYAWQNGVSTGYGFPVQGQQPPAYTNLSIVGLGIGGDISAAFDKWSSANEANGSVVSFFPNNGSAVRVYAVQVNFPVTLETAIRKERR